MNNSNDNKQLITFEQWVKERVLIDKRILGGEPVFKNSRLSVKLIGEKLNAGLEKEVREDYPYLTDDDIMFAKYY